MSDKIVNQMIKNITVVTQVGVRQYIVGHSLDDGDEIIHSIELGSLFFTGDPFSQYIGKNKDGKMIFSISPLCPHTVDYT
jgi:hypothetical protein